MLHVYIYTYIYVSTYMHVYKPVFYVLPRFTGIVFGRSSRSQKGSRIKIL
jgi:hypothetical protein